MHRLARKFATPLAFLLVAAQLLLAVPAMAGAPSAAALTAEMPCDDMPMHGDDPCPCCPEGSDSMTDCLVSCLLSATAASTLHIIQAEPDSTRAFANPPHPAPTVADPPLKPPPIA